MTQNDTDKTPEQLADRVWELADKIKTCMFVTWNGQHQRARPLVSRLARAEHAIYFLVDSHGHKNIEIENFPVVSLCYADTDSNKYVAISGAASLSDDRAKIEQLWTAFDRVWWEDASHPDIRLLTVTPDSAEIWDSPNKLVAAAVMLTQVVTGGRPALGESARLDSL